MPVARPWSCTALAEVARPVSLSAIEDVVFHPAGETDAAEVARLLKELGYPCEPGDAAVRIAAIADDERQQLLLAHCDGNVCGLIGLDYMYSLPLGATTARVTALVVSPDLHRCGLGRRLLREAERRARKAGATRLELTSASHRDSALAFCRACGYGDGAVRFVKPLGY